MFLKLWNYTQDLLHMWLPKISDRKPESKERLHILSQETLQEVLKGLI